MTSTLSDISSSNQNESGNIKPFNTLIEDLKTKMKLVFHDRGKIDQMETERGLPPFVLQEIMSVNPLSVSIRKEYGGHGAHTHEVLQDDPSEYSPHFYPQLHRALFQPTAESRCTVHSRGNLPWTDRS